MAYSVIEQHVRNHIMTAFVIYSELLNDRISVMKYSSGKSGTTILLSYYIGNMFRPMYRPSSGLLLQISP